MKTLPSTNLSISFLPKSITRLIQSEPDKFAGVTPSTSRAPREGEVNGRVYFFVDREQMEKEIAANQYLEFGELQGHLYGTRLESVREVIDQGKIAVIDCNPQVSDGID